MRLALDAELAIAVTGATAPLAHPALVCDVAIGQTTLVTQRVKANLFYRGLTFHRYPIIGDTLFTRTEVVGLKQNSAKPGRAATGLAALRMTTVDDVGRLVLDFFRCAMLPLRNDETDTGHTDDLSTIGADQAVPNDPTADWDATAFHSKVAGAQFDSALVGTVLDSTADVVSSAPELARLTLNIAATHHDWRVGGQRLVYGGHTIGLALAQATRLLPNLVTVLGWQSCDHTGPVYEGDTLYSRLHVETATPRRDGPGVVLELRSLVFAVGEPDRQVLDWRFSALHF
jgi:acyl dehydratase